MKTPKHKFLALVVLFIFVACAGTKKVTTTKSTLQVKTDTEVSIVSEEKTNSTTSVNTEKKADESVKKNVTSDENETEETTIHTILYDTKSKIDSITKRPAIASETIQQTTKGKAKKAVESSETLYSATEVTALFSKYLYSYTDKIDSLSNINASLESELTTKTTPVNNWWKWLFICFIIPIVIWFIIKMNWHTKAFVWLLNLFRFRK